MKVRSLRFVILMMAEYSGMSFFQSGVRVQDDRDSMGGVRDRPVAVGDLLLVVWPCWLLCRRTARGGDGQRYGVYRAEKNDR